MPVNGMSTTEEGMEGHTGTIHTDTAVHVPNITELGELLLL